MGRNFFQNPPQISNTFRSDVRLQDYLKKILSSETQKEIFPHLDRVGELASTTWLEWADEAEKNNPKLIQFDPWGRRIDKIETCQGWKNLEAAAAQEGIVATAYERKFGAHSRVYQMALLYLYSPSSAIYSCPLAMTDGAARVMETLGKNEPTFQKAFKNLTSRDPQLFWTSGQWMTERTGGSDVSLTSTTAELIEGDRYKIYGDKWFTSATTSQMAITLARTSDAPGSKGLSLFYLELRDENQKLKDIIVHRLKDKLGTKSLPTAELTLNGTEGRLLGGLGDGVKKITTLLNITRIYNSICALGHMRRALDLAQDYSKKRFAFGKNIIDHPLHQATLKDLEDIFTNCFKFTFFVVELLGKEESGTATENEKILLRALTPLVKLYTGKKVVEISSEVVESFGGAGYIEDTGIPRLLRDAQVFSIWEGTTNVLSLDFLRACEKEKALSILSEYFQSVQKPELIQQLKSIPFSDVSLARKNAYAVIQLVLNSIF